MAAATDAEVLVLDDAVSLSMKTLKQATNQYLNAIATIDAQKIVAATKKDAVHSADVGLAEAQQNLNVALRSRMP